MKRTDVWGAIVGWGIVTQLAACGRADSPGGGVLEADVPAAAAGTLPGNAATDAGPAARAPEDAPCAEDGVAHRYVWLQTQADIDALGSCRGVDGALILQAFPRHGHDPAALAPTGHGRALRLG